MASHPSSQGNSLTTPPSTAQRRRDHAPAPPPTSATSQPRRVPPHRARTDDDGGFGLPAIRSKNYPEQKPTSLPIPSLRVPTSPKSPTQLPATRTTKPPAGNRTGESPVFGSRTSKRVNLEDDDPDDNGCAIPWTTGSPYAAVGGSYSAGTAAGSLPIPPHAPTFRASAPLRGSVHSSVPDPKRASGRDSFSSDHISSNVPLNSTHSGAGMASNHGDLNRIGNQGNTRVRFESASADAGVRTPRPGSKNRSDPNQALAKTTGPPYRPVIPPYRPRPTVTESQLAFPRDAPAASRPGARRSTSPHRDSLKRDESKSHRNGHTLETGAKMTSCTPNANGLMSGQNLSDIFRFAAELRSLSKSNNVDTAKMQNALAFCTTTQCNVKRALEENEFNDVDLSALCKVNDILLEAIAAATKRIGTDGVVGSEIFPDDPPITLAPATSPNVRSLSSSTSPSGVNVLVGKEDIFSLILMLKAPLEKCLDSALALMDFSRQAERHRDSKSMRLRSEIRSAGGLNALLALFRTKGTTREVRVVAALAVAYLLPSLVESSTTLTPTLALRIVECLDFLFSSLPVSPRSEEIAKVEMYNASIMGLKNYLFIFPLLQLADTAFETRRARGRQRGALDHRQEALERQKLFEITVELIVKMAKLTESDMVDGAPGESKLSLRYTLVEQVCAIDAARPLAVREGLIQVLVEWVKSKDPDKVRSAATSLRDLTSTLDQYMAGWIHSQTVNSGSLGEIVKLVECTEYGHDVRLAVAQILSSLCAASHTREAVVEAQCIKYLISLLWCDDSSDPSSQQVAYAAGSALLQLAAGAMNRAGFYCADAGGDSSDALSTEKSDQVINDIVNGGAISILVGMAGSSGRGKLRSMSIEALRVLSEDTSPKRLTRLQLCDQAAKALGDVLQDDVGVLRRLLQNGNELSVAELSDMPEDVIRELHQALCALANILNPSGVLAGPVSQNHMLRLTDAEKILVHGCIQITSSGGLQSLLIIAALPFTIESLAESPQDVDVMDLLIEACRSLAALAPLLLSETADTSWTCNVLQAFTSILRRLSLREGQGGAFPLAAYELMNDALRGLSALAQSEPLKIRIVDQILPYLMKTKAATGRGDQSEVASTAGQVCLSLGFAEDELAVQVARNDPNLLGDWFCLRRSLLIQAMAREEIRIVLAHTWREAVVEAKRKGMLKTKLQRELSTHSSSASGDDVIVDYVGESGVDELFESVGKDEDSSFLRRSILSQYANLFERGTSTQANLNFPMHCADHDLMSDQPGLLCRQVYPLSSAKEENDWILGHQMALKNGAITIQSNFRDIRTSRIHKLLDCCIPSGLLQREILPLFDIRPDASFNFRALLMPQRQYFSFRREGQLVQRLCEEHAGAVESDDIHWTLAFTNSTYAGEFSETLVQAMYRCPIIQGLSFTRSGDKEGEPDEESGQLANLAGSLPPCVTDLTFDNVLNDRSVSALTSILETIGGLSTGQQKTEVIQKQGSFRLLGIRNSPHLKGKVILSFFNLLGGSRLVSSAPLASLLCLDLSGNGLDDSACSEVLKIVHSRESRCRLQQLDLSRNLIRKGEYVVEVFKAYINKHRFNEKAGVKMTKSWQSTLHTLNLSSNKLSDGKLALELIDMMKNDALSLKALDLSFNDLKFENYHFTSVMCGTLSKNSRLRELNLSGNNLDCRSIKSVIEKISESETGLTSLRFDSNTPPLSDDQLAELDEFERRSRTIALDSFLSMELRTQTGESSDAAVFPERSATIRNVDGGDDDNFSLFSEDGLSRADNLQPFTGENAITVLFSAPLVYKDGDQNLCPFEKLDFAMERDLLWACLKEASRDIKLSFDTATNSRLLAAKAMRPSCLHYSGHGHQEFLPFENDKSPGGVQWMPIGVLKDLITREGGAPFKFVFVSACFSGLAGETFASAGVPHVVCCEEESELKDAAALAFTKQFYLSLAVGNTVRESFKQGCLAVGATANVRNAELEKDKFVLLPKDGNHDIPVFNARYIPEWPRAKENKSSRYKSLSRSRSSFLGGARTCELSVRNMMQEDPSPTPPQFFLGREIDMFHILGSVLSNRLVTVTGEPGVGRSSLVCAICHYINERKSTIMNVDQILHVKMKEEGRGGERCRLLIKSLFVKLFEARKVSLPAEVHEMGVEELSKLICKALKSAKALVVFDHIELLENNDEAQDFPRFLATLFRETRFVKVLSTGRTSLGIPSIGGAIEQHYSLRGLTFSNSVKLFAKACCHLHTGAERKDFEKRMILDDQQGDLISGDPDCTERTERLFKVIGDGMPGLVEKYASSVSADEVVNLGKDE